jgi:outer membrane protein
MTHVFRTSQFWVLGLASALMVTPVLAQSSATASPTAQQPPAIERYVVGQAIPPPEPAAPPIDMTLDDAMIRALEKNLDLQVARMNPPSVDYQIRAARAAFNPVITSRYRYNDASSSVNNTFESSTVSVVTTTQNFDGGMSQALPWNGSRFTVGFNNSAVETTSTTARLNPSYSTNLQFSATQPLLQGFRIDSTRNQLRTLQVQRQIVDIQLRASIENTKASVRTAYWNLRQAIEQIEIQRLALELARRLYEDNRIKVEIGTLAPIDTVQPEAAMATAEQALLNAEIGWKTADLNLKRLIASGPEDEIYRMTINPNERAVQGVQAVDIPGAVRNALAVRTDLVVARRNLDVSRLNLELSSNQTKPQLDLQGGYNVSGQGGSPLIDGLRGPGGYGDAFRQLTNLGLPTWNFQFNLTYPLFMAAANANHARAQLQFQQSEASIKAQELTISNEVTNAGLAVENTYKQYQAAVKSREAQERNVEAEQTRFDVGMSTNFNVVQVQNSLTLARLSELSRVIAHLNAVAEFERVQIVGR